MYKYKENKNVCEKQERLDSKANWLRKINIMENNKNWTEVHKDFAKRAVLSEKTYQEEWERYDLTYQDAKEWIAIRRINWTSIRL